MSIENRLDGFGVGSSAEFSHIISAEDIRRFVELTGDDNPLHLDRQFAEKTTFKGIVAHGMLTASFISTIIGKHIPGRGALWMSQNLEFLLPVRIGDRLQIRATVTAVQVSQRLLSLRTEISNQHEQLVLTGESKVKVLEANPEPALKPEKPVTEVVIVTGASRGIGAATALLLASQGYAVVVNFHKDEEGALRLLSRIEQAAGRAVAVRGDVSRREDAKRLVETAVSRFGGLGAIVNNASPPPIPKPFAKLSSEDIEAHIRVQYYGAFNLIQEALPHLERASNAAVVNIGSIYTDNVPSSQMAHYCAAKAALTSLTKSLAVEYGPKGIRFNILAPGMTETVMIADLPEKAKMLARMQTPLRRLGTPEDAAAGVAFLLGPGGRHITGETLRVCGGAVMI